MNQVFNGAWRGIFWHRNHMGSLMAFFSSLSLFYVAAKWGNWKHVTFNALMFVLSSVLVFGSWSATGIIIYFVLNAHLVLALLWLRYRLHLNRKRYLIILGIILTAVCVLIFNLDVIFQLLRRSSTLTGRTFIWEDMLVNLWPQRPLFGYGFGAIWNQEYYRVLIQTRHSWAFQVYFADNGFLDLLLNTGLIGLGLFLVFFVRTGIQALQLFIRQHSVLSVIPVLVFAYVFWANISYSFLSEVDQFVWMLLIISAFLPIKLAGENATANSKTSSPQP
jgi:O-antigen ligase